MPIPFIKHMIFVEHTEIERAVFSIIRPKHRHRLGSLQTVPEEMEAYFYFQVPYYHVECRPILNCVDLTHRALLTHIIASFWLRFHTCALD